MLYASLCNTPAIEPEGFITPAIVKPKEAKRFPPSRTVSGTVALDKRVPILTNVKTLKV